MASFSLLIIFVDQVINSNQNHAHIKQNNIQKSQVTFFITNTFPNEISH
jgi:hypothetical protein